MIVIKLRAAMECPREELIGVPGTSSELKNYANGLWIVSKASNLDKKKCLIVLETLVFLRYSTLLPGEKSLLLLKDHSCPTREPILRTDFASQHCTT
jgi:hypothetical protein